MLRPHLLVLPFLISCVLSYDGEHLLHYDLDQAEEYFSYFVTTYNKTYYSESEKKLRFQIFKHNLAHINEMNEIHGYIISGITNYSDLTSTEFIRSRTGFKAIDKTASRSGRSMDGFCTVIDDKTITVGDLPRNFDWRSKNKVTAVKNQYDCGSCWAFAAIASIESLHAIKTGELISLSEQQLLECDSRDCGCCGGQSERAFLYLSETGLATEKEYPYDHNNIGKCRNIRKPRVFVDGCINYDFTDEDKIRQVLFENGPAVIGIDATDIIHIHNGNILKKCEIKSGINHAVLLVGYGEEEGVPYWIIKNSWGNWGDEGYVKVKRGINACGMLNSFVNYAKLA